ncbi:MAG: hypothetical protein LBT46_07990 [Planctomycetaceae bacterium]|jgi:methylase of polypeptide subunit release factors|nr:hypothetical protein [Planctomycetaceae bacterium]
MVPPDVRIDEPKPVLPAGKTGTEIIERLIHQSANRLKDGGHILLEVSPMIAGAVKMRLLRTETAVFPPNSLFETQMKNLRRGR